MQVRRTIGVNRCLGALLLFFLTSILLVPSALAQYAETRGTIEGVVKDATGAVIPGVNVEISSPALITSQKQQTDSTGYYRFAELPPGTYTVVVTATGFSQVKQTGIKLEVGKRLAIDFTLQVGAVAQTIEVQAAGVLIDTTSSKAAVNFTMEQIENIPKGRSAFYLITLAPGARFEPLQGSVRGDARGVTAGYQIDGASDGENAYMVEGMDTTNIRTGGIGVNIPVEFVQEVQVKSSGFEAQYGGALGGVVNVVQKGGGNTWHGSVLMYYRSNTLQASDRPNAGLRTGLRSNPRESLSSALRLSESPEYYQPKEDRWKLIEPGFELGGYIRKDKLWLFASYIPSLYRQTRTVNFNYRPAAGAPFVGPRSFPSSDTQHNTLARLDWQATSKIRASFGWFYAYRRAQGLGTTLAGTDGTAIPGRDSAYFNPATPSLQFNPDSTRDPGSFRPDFGFVAPNATYTANVNWTINPKFVVDVRYGYWFSNLEDRGRPTGVRFAYDLATTGVTGLDGSAIPAGVQGATGFANIPSNLQTIFDSFTRHGLNVDASYMFRGFGSHNFKVGYAFNRISNNVRSVFNTANVLISWGLDRAPNVITGAGQAFCATNRAQNRSRYGRDVCQGIYGVYYVNDGVGTVGQVNSISHALYFQDAWTVTKGLTLNLGLRFDKEFLPSYKPGTGAIQNPIDFGFGSKVAPRLGAAWDVFRNGKLKVYASWGLFYDIMKYEMPRGAFGGEYWHDCWYTLDTTDLSSINPQPDARGHVCPGGGGTPGSKIEEIDWRAVANDPSDNRLAPGIKPMRQREMVLGGEYALRPNIGLEVRYARKRLDRTIEDTGFFDALGENYYIGNPGEGVLRNPVAGVCPTCPNQPKATRNYDGLEFKVTKRWSANWFAVGSYTYSRLWGNYGGLTSTDEQGRHSPNVNRYFDLPHMAWDAHGKPVYGLLPTDRPHTLKMYGAYQLKWWGMESTFGLTQVIYSGSPISTELGVIGSSTSTSFIEGRSNFVDITRDAATGNWVAGGISSGVRLDPFTQSDFLVTHEFKLSKSNEALRATLELDVRNLFNQNNVLNIINRPLRTGVLRFPGALAGIPDWQTALTGYDYIARINAQRLILDSRYGMASFFQDPRSLRLKLKFSF